MMDGYEHIKIEYHNNVGEVKHSTFGGLLEELLLDWQGYFDTDFSYHNSSDVKHSIGQLTTIQSILRMMDGLSSYRFPIDELIIFAANRGYRVKGYEITEEKK